MNATLFAAPAALPLASFRRAVSAPVPWYASHAARRAVEGLQRGVSARSPRIAAAMRRAAAHNAVARDRLFAALAEALGREIAPQRHLARRHAALTATALADALPQAHEPGEQAGIAQDTLLCVTGKKIDLRGIVRLLEVPHHACARFLERTGQRDPAALVAAIEEAARHAAAVLVAHIQGGLAYRLRSGSASVLLPAGEGAFLGRLRLLPQRRDGAPLPVIEAATWLHVAALDPSQIRARDVLLAGVAPAVLVAALPEAWAELRGNVMGDRRVRSGLEVLPFPLGENLKARLAIACCPPVAVARLALGLACADTLAAEWEGAQ